MGGAAEAADRWAGASSEGDGIAKLRDPNFLLVMGNYGGGVDISHLIVINGGFPEEADLDGLER